MSEYIKFCWKKLSFERQQELCWRFCIKNPFYVDFKMLDEMKKNCFQNNTKCTKKIHFLAQNVPS